MKEVKQKKKTNDTTLLNITAEIIGWLAEHRKERRAGVLPCLAVISDLVCEYAF